VGGVFHDRGDVVAPGGERFGEFAGEAGREAACALACFDEVGGGEGALGEQREDVAVDEWSHGFHQVESE
jgi:hypothetical protein